MTIVGGQVMTKPSLRVPRLRVTENYQAKTTDEQPIKHIPFDEKMTDYCLVSG